MPEQRWLTLDSLCGTLGITRRNGEWLARNGYIGVLKGRTKAENRYLDPTPEYAAKLRLGEALYGRRHPLPIELEKTPLLTLREIAMIMGWTMKAIRHRHDRGQLGKGVKVGQYVLYNMEMVRDILWKKQGRRHSKQRDPFLIEELVAFFREYYEQECAEVPSDLDFAKDARLQKKLERVAKLPSPHREIALRSLAEKMRLAGSVARDLVHGE